MPFSITPAVRNLLIINIVLFFAGELLRVDLADKFALRYFESSYFRPYQILSYMFLHGSTRHLISNMFGLLIFGPLLERLWGMNRFLLFYLICGIGGAFLHSVINYFEFAKVEQAVNLYIQHPSPQSFMGFVNKYTAASALQIKEAIDEFSKNPTDKTMITETTNFLKSFVNSWKDNSTMLGASAAVLGLTFAFGYLFPNTEMMLMFIPVPVKAKYLIAFYVFFELYTGIRRSQGDNVAHFAHLGGMIFAFILLKIWGNSRQNFY